MYYNGIKRGFKALVNREEGYKKYAIPSIITMVGVHIFNLVLYMMQTNDSSGEIKEAEWSVRILEDCPNGITHN